MTFFFIIKCGLKKQPMQKHARASSILATLLNFIKHQDNQQDPSMYIYVFSSKNSCKRERKKEKDMHGLVKMLHGELEMQWKGWDHGRVEKAPREQAAMMSMMCACVPVRAWRTSRERHFSAAFQARPGGPHASCPASPAT